MTYFNTDDFSNDHTIRNTRTAFFNDKTALDKAFFKLYICIPKIFMISGLNF